MSKRNFHISTSGSWLGVKINTTGPRFAKEMAKTKLGRPDFLKIIMPMFRDVLKKKRLPVLKSRLIDGNYKGTVGTRQFENSSHGSHKPHYDNPNPISYIFKAHMHYGIVVDGDKLKVTMNLRNGGNKRDAKANFHYEMDTVARVSTVLSRLDATCLPYFQEGHKDKILDIWLTQSQKTMTARFKKYLREGK